MSLAHNLCGEQLLAGTIDDCIKMSSRKRIMPARIRGLKILYLCLPTACVYPHLRCGLQEYRQLCWLRSTFVNTSSLYRALFMQQSIKPNEFNDSAQLCPDTKHF